MHSALATLSGADRPNEDFVVATDKLAVVLDGVTSPSRLKTGCIHGPSWFSRALGSEIIGHLTAEPTMSLADGLAGAIKSLAVRHSATCDVNHPAHPSATVAVVREADDAIEYLVLADATVAVNTSQGVQVFTDNRHDQVATEYQDALRAAPQGSAEHADAYVALMTALSEHRNRPGGFWVAAADPQAAYEAITGTLASASVLSAAALSDGASILVDRFRIMEWPELFDLLAAGGPHGLLRRVREVEDSDPDGTRWPRGKVHDDASVIYCTL